MPMFKRKQPDPISLSLRADPSLDPSAFPKPASHTITLPSRAGLPARTLSYAIYGSHSHSHPHSATAAPTLLFLHGTPGTRFFFSAAHDAHAKAHHVRVLVPERPGYGLSTPHPSRTLLSCAEDLAAFLDAVRVDAAYVVGYSAGGPFALAFARHFPERCQRVAVVSSLSPNVPGVVRGMTVTSRVGYFLAGRAPRVLMWLVWAMAKGAVAEVYDDTRDDLTDAENDFFKQREDVRRLFAESTLELYAREGGALAEAEDYVLFASDWGFRLEDVRTNVLLYGGDRDNKCTLGMFRELERGLAGNVTVKLVEGGHHLMFYELFEGGLFEDLGLLAAQAAIGVG